MKLLNNLRYLIIEVLKYQKYIEKYREEVLLFYWGWQIIIKAKY
jgi:hypothetical protein